MKQGAVLRLMIVDDHPLVRTAVEHTLAAEDVEVVAMAGSAEEGVRLAAKVRPDIILVDIDLPGSSGLDLIHELRPRLPATKFIVLSVSQSPQLVDAAVLAGASGYLTKELDPAALRRAVRGAWRGELAMPRVLAGEMVVRLAQRARRGQPAETDGRLTPREWEVQRLLARGLTNREIGETLGLSPRTVERHVASILNKLDVPNRAAAAQALGDD